MPYCPCCSEVLLLHIRHAEIYWFCRHCWSEMPVSMEEELSLLPQELSAGLWKKLHECGKSVTKIYTSHRQSVTESM